MVSKYNAETQQLVLEFTEALQNRHLAVFLDILKRISDIPTRDAASEHLKQALYAEMEQERKNSVLWQIVGLHPILMYL